MCIDVKQFLLVLTFSVFSTSGISQNTAEEFYKKAKEYEGVDNSDQQSSWSLSLGAIPGTNIDFSAPDGSTSSSGTFKLNGNSTGIESDFLAYDSRGNYLPASLGGSDVGPFTDQANSYLATLTNEKSGLSITGGIIHDKRQQSPNQAGNTFRYKKGGLELASLAGKQFGIAGGNVDQGGFLAQVQAGGFISFNDIDIDLTSTSGTNFFRKGLFRRRSCCYCFCVIRFYYK